MKWFFSWSLPDTRDQTKIHRKVSRLDLFFDLIYVLLFRDLFYFLSGDLSNDVFLKIALFFVPVRLVRHGYNFYVQRFEETTIRHRMMTFIMMWCIGVYSFSIHAQGLVVTDLLIYAAVCVHYLLWYLFISATKNPKNNEVSDIAIIVWSAHILYAIVRFIGWFTLPPEQFIWLVAWTSFLFLALLWALPLMIDKVPEVHSEHLWERFWLFIIIVLAELIYGLIVWVTDAAFIDFNVIAVSIWGFMMAIAIRRLYFDIIGHNPMKKRSMQYVTIWSLLHLPLSLGIIYLWGMFLHMIFQVSSEFIQTDLMFITWLLVLGLFLIIGLLSFFHEFELKPRAKKRWLKETSLGWFMIGQVVVLSLVLRTLQISDPANLVYILLWFFTLNIIWFHYLFDPLDIEESFE